MVIDWFHVFLYLHVLGAIVAFGPAFTFRLIGAMGRAEPQHANFAIRLSNRISKSIVLPVAGTMAVTGVGMLWALQINPMDHGWLIAGITLYVIALGLSLFVQTPTVQRIIEMTSAPPPPGAAGPPPELVALIAASRRNGIILLVLIVVIVYLMVVKPGG